VRSVKKGKVVSKKSDSKFSGSEVIELAKVGADVVKSGFDWLNEIEKTKQLSIEAQVRITESNNKLAMEMARFEKEMLEIQRNFELEFKRLDDDFKLRNRQLDLIEKLIDKIDKIEVEIKVYQKEEGLNSHYVMTLFEQLHQQKLSYMNNLVQLGQN